MRRAAELNPSDVDRIAEPGDLDRVREATSMFLELVDQN